MSYRTLDWSPVGLVAVLIRDSTWFAEVNGWKITDGESFMAVVANGLMYLGCLSGWVEFWTKEVIDLHSWVDEFGEHPGEAANFTAYLVDYADP